VVLLECMATHTGIDNPPCCIPSQKAEVSLASADAELLRCVWAASEGVVGEAYEAYGECGAQPMWYALPRAVAWDGTRAWRPTAANAQAEKKTRVK